MKVKSAKYIDDYKVELTFDDKKINIINFFPVIKSNPVPASKGIELLFGISLELRPIAQINIQRARLGRINNRSCFFTIIGHKPI